MIPDAPHYRRDPFTLLIVLIAGLGTAHILVRTATYGAAVITDSIIFLSTALNFLAGEGWRDFTGGLTVGGPPLFSLLLAVGGWVGIEPLKVGRWVNAMAFGMTIFVAGCWLRSNLRSRWLALAATAILAASRPLSELASAVMTEPLFVLFTLLALMQLTAFLQRDERTSLWWAAVFTALAVLTRYLGVVLIGAGILMLLVRRTPPLVALLKDAGVFGAISSIPLAGVLTRNWVLSDTLTGGRSGSGQSLFDSLSQVVDVFREWVIPRDAVEWFAYILRRATGLGTPDWFGSLLWAATGLVVVAMVAVVVLSGRGRSPFFRLGPALSFGVFAGAYLVFMVVVVPLTVTQIIDSRYLLPIYVPLLLTAVFLLDRFLCIEVAGRMAAVRYGLASLVLLGLGGVVHVGFSVRENLRITTKAWGAGLDGAYNTAAWQQSETLNYIRDNRIEGNTYSNNPFVVWFVNRPVTVNERSKHGALPFKIRDWTQDPISESDAASDVPIYPIIWIKDDRIVWIKDDYRSVYYDYNDLDIRLLPNVEVVTELSDGVVFRLTAAPEPFDEDRHRARKQRYVQQLIAQADEQVVRAGWGVHRTGRKLIYFKEPCAPADVQAKFVLHVVPTDPVNLSAARKRYGSENLGFYFTERGEWLDDQCIAIIRLPTYAIDRIHVGQWISAENRTVWEAELPADR